ncbi:MULTISPECIES: WbuC family cupin fold metalloprotein [unclassified Bradyrhizobium]|uniref:WbuC family cupin fold metalloprotein n=1 Tax=unclassified Bradyrhizobium TaxID=2631580 RepID=UPI0028EF09DF|nr:MULTISPECIES: WbuC family cupin fold metalloprotein [unclassified Bradyrhizobium]
MDQPDHRLREVSPEVLYSDGGFLAVDDRIVQLLKNKAAKSPRRRCRLCFHASSDDLQQEMLIVMHRSSYVRPHRHLRRSETLAVIEGNCETLLFDEDGQLTERLPMSAAAEGGRFFYKMPPGIFHTLIFRSEWLVFLETTIGPFDPTSSEAASWAPPETDPAAGHSYLAGLESAGASR